MVPFMVTTPFTGPIARTLDGVDISRLVGLPVAALAYLMLSHGSTWPPNVVSSRKVGSARTGDQLLSVALG
jgi:hypothetical protein